MIKSHNFRINIAEDPSIKYVMARCSIIIEAHTNLCERSSELIVNKPSEVHFFDTRQEFGKQFLTEFGNDGTFRCVVI